MLRLIKNDKLRRVIAILLALAIVAASVLSSLSIFWG